MNASLPMIARKLSLGYSDPEDRLVLLASDVAGVQITLLLTRRLTGGLINSLAHVLERSSAVAAKAPAEMLDDIILMEHQEALYGESENKKSEAAAEPGTGSGASAASKPKKPVAPGRLVTTINLAMKQSLFQIVLHDAQGAVLRLSLSRSSLHRILDAISRHAQAADWNIAIDASWLEPGQAEIVLN